MLLYYVVDLIWCTNIGDVSIPELVRHLQERTQSTSWVVVLKALLTMHDIINYGNDVMRLYKNYTRPTAISAMINCVDFGHFIVPVPSILNFVAYYRLLECGEIKHSSLWI